MQNLTDIKYRIKSVTDTRQITSAMETISIAKMRKSMLRFENSRRFFEGIRSTINDIVCRTGHIPSLFFKETDEDSRVVHIVIASDKGLAGGFNNNILKHAWTQIETCKNCSVFTVGQTVREFFEHKGVFIDVEFSDAAYDPSKKNALEIMERVMNLYMSHEIDEVLITYTKMESSTSMAPETFKLLPFSPKEAQRIRNEMSVEKEYMLGDIEYDPSPEEVLEMLVPQYVAWVIYGALVMSSASEHCSRHYAMNNATKNASEILSGLKIDYNRARQETITNELSEIITSTSAVKK